jgi:hypothetical protein
MTLFEDFDEGELPFIETNKKVITNEINPPKSGCKKCKRPLLSRDVREHLIIMNMPDF